MGFFNTDIKRGKVGEELVKKFLSYRYPDKKFKSSIGKFKDWDLIEDCPKNPLTIEVKFDEMSEKTGNLAFEVTDGKFLTGIFASSAKDVYYLTPIPYGFGIFIFDRIKLIEYLENSPHARGVNGGDNRKFSLLLVPIEQIKKDNIAEYIQWVEKQD